MRRFDEIGETPTGLYKGRTSSRLRRRPGGRGGRRVQAVGRGFGGWVQRLRRGARLRRQAKGCSSSPHAPFFRGKASRQFAIGTGAHHGQTCFRVT
jgi:hypothetical protein